MSLTIATIEGALKWLETCDVAKLRKMLQEGEWVIQTDIPASASDDEVREIAADLLYEDYVYVAITLKKVGLRIEYEGEWCSDEKD